MAHVRADSAFSNHKSHLLDALEDAITESNNRLNAAEQMPFNAYRRQDIFLHPNGYLRTNTALRSYQGPAFYSEILADLEDLEEGFMHAEQLVEENNRIVVTEVMGLESLGDGLVKAAREGGQEVWYQALVWNGEDYDSGGLSSACSEDIDSLEFGKLETEERNERERTLRGRAARAAMLSPLHTTGSTTQSPSPFDDNMDAAAIEKKMAEIEAAKEKIDQHRIEVAKGTMNMLGLGWDNDDVYFFSTEVFAHGHAREREMDWTARLTRQRPQHSIPTSTLRLIPAFDIGIPLSHPRHPANITIAVTDPKRDIEDFVEWFEDVYKMDFSAIPWSGKWSD